MILNKHLLAICGAFLTLSQYLAQLWVVKGQIFAKLTIFNFKSLYLKTVNNSDMSLLPVFSRSILNRITCCSLLTEYLWRTASRKGTALPQSAKPPDGKLGQWPWLTSDNVKRHCKHVDVKNYMVTYSISVPKKNREISHYIGLYGFSQGQWPRMTFEKSICIVKGQMWSSFDLSHA